MSELVFILGAGASADAGGPLMRDFLNRAETLLPADPNVRRVLRASSKLQHVQAKTSFDIHNIEWIFGAVEMAKIIGRFPGFETQEIDELSQAVNAVIAGTLQKAIKLNYKEKQVHPTPTYDHFAKVLIELNDNGRKNRASVITFNYDLALDYALQFNHQPAQYCLDLAQIKPGPVRLLKLHGSLNWGRCKLCGGIVPAATFFHNAHFTSSEARVEIPVDRYLRSLQCCDQAIDPTPIIVPPIWNKTEYHGRLQSVWRQAALELSEAREIYICGYSLPQSDSFFSYLFALGSAGDATLRKVAVYNPDQEVHSRVRGLLAKHLELECFSWEFREAIGYIQQNLKVSV